jgi:PhnB protein
MKLNPYLMFNGQCKEAFAFYEQCLGGKIVAMFPFKDMPGAEEHVSAASRDLIMHASLQIDDDTLMGSDSPPEMYEDAKGKGTYTSIHVKTAAEAERIFHALSEGADVRMPIQETFWALRFAMLVDRFGIPWMINCEKPQ